MAFKKVSRLSRLWPFSVKFLLTAFFVSHVGSFTGKALNRDNRDKTME
jgi:hypothetical protein